MRRLLAVSATALTCLAVPAQATEWLICSDGENKASFSVLMGSLGVGTATDFEVVAGDKAWSTKPGEGTPITRLQAYETDQMLLADVATEDLAETVAELRVLKASEGDDYVYGGTLRIAGVGVYAVKCD